MNGTILLIGRFFLLIGAALFVLVGGVAWALSEATEICKAHNTPWHLWYGIELLSEAVFAVDGLCFMAFILIEAYMLVVLMLRNASAELKQAGIK